LVSNVHLYRFGLKAPTIMQEESASSRNDPGSVEIRLPDRDTRRIVDPIDFRASDIQTDANAVLAGQKWDTGNITNKHLFTTAGLVETFWLVGRVSRTDALARSRVKSNRGIEACAGLLKVKCDYGL
jgi:hypothetical protein